MPSTLSLIIACWAVYAKGVQLIDQLHMQMHFNSAAILTSSSTVEDGCSTHKHGAVKPASKLQYL